MRKLYYRLKTWRKRRQLQRQLDTLAGMLTAAFGRAEAAFIRDEWMRCYQALEKLEKTYTN